MKVILLALGLVFIIEGLPYFTFPDRIRSYLLRVAELPGSTLRTFGFISIIIGAVLVFLARP